MRSYLRWLVRTIIRRIIRDAVLDVVMHDVRIWGDPARLQIASTAHLNNALLNTSSGCIHIGEHTFAGHDVALITGGHDYREFSLNRKRAVPRDGNDIHIGEGVWIGSRAVVLGPCRIGAHAVIAAGAVVRTDIPACAIAAGVPAKVVRLINPESMQPYSSPPQAPMPDDTSPG